jgi:hypothetical protein
MPTGIWIAVKVALEIRGRGVLKKSTRSRHVVGDQSLLPANCGKLPVCAQRNGEAAHRPGLATKFSERVDRLVCGYAKSWSNDRRRGTVANLRFVA